MDASKPKVAVVMTMLELYRKADPKRPAAAEALWRPVVEHLFSGAAEVHLAGVALTADEMARAVDSALKADCDLLVVLPLSYAPSGAAVDALRRTDIPLLVLSTARDATLPHDMGSDHIMANHAVHGVQDLANVLGRELRPFEVIAGHHSNPAFRERVRGAAAAAAAARIFRKGKVGRIGQPFEDMLDFDPGDGFADSFGLEVIAFEPEALGDTAAEVSDDRTADFARWASGQFTIGPDVTSDLLETSARWSLALEDVAEAAELDALSMNFLALADAGAETMPFLGASRLMTRGIGYAGEGDIITAALVAAMARIAGEATFTEMFCPDYERSEVLLSHMGECNFALANPARPVLLVAKDFAFGDCVKPAVPVFQLRPGVVTLACVTQWPGEGFRLITCIGEVLDAPEHPNLTSPYSRIAFGRGLPEFLEAYSRAGGIHHLALCYGDRLRELAMFATFLGLGHVTVH